MQRLVSSEDCEASGSASTGGPRWGAGEGWELCEEVGEEERSSKRVRWALRDEDVSAEVKATGRGGTIGA